MKLIYLGDPLIELTISLNYIISIFILQVGLFFIKQWYLERKRQIKNDISLSYGLYFLFFSLGISIYYHAIYNDISTQIFDSIFLLSILIKGIGGFFFSIIMEHNIQKILKTRYFFSLLSLILISTIPFFSYYSFFSQILDIFNIFHLVLPLFFTFYFMRNTFGEVRRKLKISIIGIIIISLMVSLSSKKRLEVIENLFPFYSMLFLVSKIIAIFGIFLVSNGFTGYSFSLESQWKENLISLYIIDKKRHLSLYHKDFLESEVESEGLFAGGVAGIVKALKDFTESSKEIDTISIKNRLIYLEVGKDIVTAFIVKKNLLNVRYVLKEITSKFEFYFWDYLKSYAQFSYEIDIFKPTEMIVKKLIKF